MIQFTRQKGQMIKGGDFTVLAIDIGNTNIVFGGFQEGKLTFTARISTDAARTQDEYAGLILTTLALHDVDRKKVTGAVISSVVPPLNSVMKGAVRCIYGVDSMIVGPGIKTGINIHCDTPSSVGADIICACVAVQKLYSSPALIIDMGTATKMSVLSSKGAFVGVSIIPGVMMGLDALSERTAQLPRVSLDVPDKVIGKNTADCMRSGVIYGNASMIDGMIDRIIEEVGQELPLYATGGMAQTIVGHCKHDIILDEHLVLKGLNIIFEKNS